MLRRLSIVVWILFSGSFEDDEEDEKSHHMTSFPYCPSSFSPDTEDEKIQEPSQEDVEACIAESSNSIKYNVDEVVQSMTLTHAYISHAARQDGMPAEEGDNVPMIVLNDFLSTLNLVQEDFVVIKMDIEGSEYKVMEALLARPDLVEVIDEMMIECHYSHPEMAWAYWDENFPEYSLSDAHVLLQRGRDAGIVVHPWP